MLFYGRRRRGFPWLMAGVFTALLILAGVFSIPGGADISRSIFVIVFGALMAGAFVFALLAFLLPRIRR